jgi:predicted O-methyltransferase YrrM
MRGTRTEPPVNELTAALKGLLRPGARAVERGRQRHRQYQLHRSLRALRKYPSVALAPASPLLRRLVYGWGNEGWSAREEYLRAMIQEALVSPGPVLECGSGLTTLVLASIVGGRGVAVWTLEHQAEWAERVRRELSAMGDRSVTLSERPMRSAAEFDWYDPPLDAMPPRFALVVCDGPPTTTRGGRYGLAPILRDRLAPGTVILLDDAERPAEREIAARWAAELDADCEVFGTQKPFYRLVLRDPRAGR